MAQRGNDDILEFVCVRCGKPMTDDDMIYTEDGEGAHEACVFEAMAEASMTWEGTG